MKSRLADIEEPEIENSERWLLTYADMITLLLALFIVLFAVSTINTKKFEALALGFKQSFSPNPGVLPSSNGVEQYDSLVPTAGPRQVQQHPNITTPMKQTTTSSTLPPSLSTSAEKQLASVDQQVAKALEAKGLAASVTTSLQSRGLVVQILTDQVFFATDSAKLGPEGNGVVDTIASVLRTTSNDIDVEGYTDNQGITGGPYATNEELSAVRAASVASRLTDHDGLDPNRLAATGFGASDPAAPNDTPANRALNRRIDFVILAPGASQP
jgi:chemotaxis protein MotB